MRGLSLQAYTSAHTYKYVTTAAVNSSKVATLSL